MTYELRKAEALILQIKDQIAYENIRRITNKYLFEIIMEKIRFANEIGEVV